MEHYYSDFWLVDRGVLTLPDWKHKPYEPFEVPTALPPLIDDELPSAAELSWYANLNFTDRQAVELALGGEVYTLKPDAGDAKLRRMQRKRAA